MIPPFSTKFFLNRDKGKGDQHPIYLRIIINRKKVEIATNFSINLHEWDENKQRAKKNVKINQELASVENEIYEIIRQLDQEGKAVDVKTVKNILTRKEHINARLLEFFNSHLTRLSLNPEMEEVTVVQYRATFKHISAFVQSLGIEDIELRHVDFKFISDFDQHLLRQTTSGTNTPLLRNTVNKHHSRLRTVLIRAIREEHISKNPYTNFKLKNTPSKRTFLSEEELQRIIDHPLQENDSLIRVRDLFIFSAYTGLRFTDAQNLTMKEIGTNEKGEYFLFTEQGKTKVDVHIPLLKPAIDIINKYDNAERQITGKLLPKISNQKVNAYLKVIADLAQIDKTLSHHVARHTCATTVLLSNEAPIEIVSKWLGHTNIKTTQIYAKITEKYLHRIADKVSQRIDEIEKSKSDPALMNQKGSF